MWDDYDGDGSYPHDGKHVKCICGEGYNWTDDELVRKLRKTLYIVYYKHLDMEIYKWGIVISYNVWYNCLCRIRADWNK